MPERRATATASPNIAFIKYWGNRDPALRLPANASLSMTLSNLQTNTTVLFDDRLEADQIEIDGSPASDKAASRVTKHLDLIRTLSGNPTFANIHSLSNFPAGAGIASSASAFAALTAAASKAAGLELDKKQLSILARRGSGSAARSIFGGFVQLFSGEVNTDGYAEQLAPAEHWHLVNLIAVVTKEHKSIGSSEGHMLAPTSSIQAIRVQDTARRLEICKKAIMQKDFQTLAQIVELDSNLMHSVMMTSDPPILYLEPESISVMKHVTRWREDGLAVCYTIDAGPNVHCICSLEDSPEVERQLRSIDGILDIYRCSPGNGVALAVTNEQSPQ
ncbi:MAG: diphosphomevalonate decarboxylase [Anaerolineales bacterium]|nr:MAG: diphosphomevalonate decarboxylase [Anaerolineales bacterium]